VLVDRLRWSIGRALKIMAIAAVGAAYAGSPAGL